MVFIDFYLWALYYALKGNRKLCILVVSFTVGEVHHWLHVGKYGNTAVHMCNNLSFKAFFGEQEVA